MPEVDVATRRKFADAMRRAKVEQRGPREAPTDRDWATLLRPGTAAGAPKRERAPKLSATFQRRERTLSTIGRGVSRFRRSDWVGDLSAKRRPVEDALDVIGARAIEKPNEATLREVQIVLNDLGRLSGGSEGVTRRLTQELVDQLIAGGKRR